VTTWPACERLLPHLLAATGHAVRLGMAGEAVGWLLDRASMQLRNRGQYRQARPIVERALAVTEAALGPYDPELPWRRTIWAVCCRSLGSWRAPGCSWSGR
jgi:hypothetical protein